MEHPRNISIRHAMAQEVRSDTICSSGLVTVQKIPYAFCLTELKIELEFGYKNEGEITHKILWPRIGKEDCRLLLTAGG